MFTHSSTQTRRVEHDSSTFKADNRTVSRKEKASRKLVNVVNAGILKIRQLKKRGVGNTYYRPILHLGVFSGPRLAVTVAQTLLYPLSFPRKGLRPTLRTELQLALGPTVLVQVQFVCPTLKTRRELATRERASTCLIARAVSCLAVEVPDERTGSRCELETTGTCFLATERLFGGCEIVDIIGLSRIESDDQLEEVVVVCWCIDSALPTMRKNGTY